MNGRNKKLVIIVSVTLLGVASVNGDDQNNINDAGGVQRSRQGRQFAGLGWRLLETSKKRLEEDKSLGQRNVALIKDTRRRFWDSINNAMEREQAHEADSRDGLMTRFDGVKNMLRNAIRRDAERREASMNAINNIMSLGSSHRKSFNELTPMDMLNPLNIVRFWTNAIGRK